MSSDVDGWVRVMECHQGYIGGLGLWSVIRGSDGWIWVKECHQK